jgi:predicted transcriptional regulator
MLRIKSTSSREMEGECMGAGFDTERRGVRAVVGMKIVESRAVDIDHVGLNW